MWQFFQLKIAEHFVFSKCSRIPKWLKTCQGVKIDHIFHIFKLNWVPKKSGILFPAPKIFFTFEECNQGCFHENIKIASKEASKISTFQQKFTIEN